MQSVRAFYGTESNIPTYYGKALCDFGGQQWMGTDPRFQEPGLSMYNSPEDDVTAIRAGCSKMFLSHSLADWEAFFGSEPNFVWSPVLSSEEVL